MKNKVDKKQKKASEEKLGLNLPYPKVVLDAADCARLLDGSSKTSVVVVEHGGKMVAAKSLLTSTSSNTKPTTALNTTDPGLSTTLISAPIANSEIISAGFSNLKVDEICPNLPSSSKSAATESMTKEKCQQQKETEKDSKPCIITETSVQSKPILKPPKKRRGIGMNFENDVSSQEMVLKNGEHMPPVLLPSDARGEDANSSSPGQSTNPSSLSAHSYSVERFLQNNNKPSVESETRRSESDTQLTCVMISSERLQTTNLCRTVVPSFEFSTSSSSVLHAPLSPLPSSKASAAYTLSSQSSRQHQLKYPCQPFLQNVAEVNKSSSEKIVSSTSNSHDLCRDSYQNDLCNPPKDNASTLKPSDITAHVEQEEPINLSTTSKVESSSVTTHLTNVTSDSNSNFLPSVSLEKKPRALSTNMSNDTLQLLPEGEVSMGHNTTMPFHPQQHSVLSSDSNCHELSRPKDVASVESHQPACHVVPEVLSQLSTATNQTTSFASLSTNSEVVPSSHPMISEQHDNSVTKVNSMKETISVPDIHVRESSIQENTSAGNDHLKNSETFSKFKKPIKKRAEIPMDELSCAKRVAQYAMTIDDVITNFVYNPEPEEEIRLTEDEEQALRDQFELDETKVTQLSSHPVENLENENMSSENSQCSTNPATVISPPHHSAETQTPITHTMKSVKQHLLSTKEKHAEAAGANQRRNNIDEVLASVVADICRPEGKSKKKKKNCVGKGKLGLAKADSENIKSGQLKEETVTETNDSHSRAAADTSKVIKHGLSKSSKPKKRKSVDNSSAKDGNGSEKQGTKVSAKKKKKADDNKSEHNKKSFNSALDCATTSELPSSILEVNKDILGHNKNSETSDIGESIASTSGGSEQDTPIHETEGLSSKLGHSGQGLADKESRDTGLESSGGEESSHKEPKRRYKKRLDYVKCDRCDHQARGRAALSRHMKKVHELDADMPHRCPHCSYGCSKQASLLRHLFTHGVFSCSRCSFVGQERLALTQHVLEHHRDKLDLKLCKVCNRYIKCDQVTIEEHSAACQGPTPYKCSVCDKEFKYGSSLRVHYHTHFPDQPKKFKCEECEYRTNYKANLHKHHKNMHAASGKEIQCPDCGKFFSTEDNMRRHRKLHTLSRPFACETCKKSFKTPGALKGHQLIHTATRPYICNISGCGRSFRTPKFLKSHQEEFHRLVPKKFFCSVEGCNYSFFKRSHLKRHAITHTGERNFHCTWPGCSKSFRHADNLKVHFRSHSSEKTLQCHLCDFKTKQKNSMFWHKKKVHQLVESLSLPSKKNVGKQGNVEPEDKHDIPKLSEVPSGTPAMAESGCQTALAMSEPSEDGSTVLEEDVKSSARLSSDNTSLTEQSSAICSATFSTSNNLDKHNYNRLTGTSESARKDLYEFKSDEESEDEAQPGNFRRDLIPKDEIKPLPPPPKELLKQNEIEEQKEIARKEREWKKEQEKKEKAEKRELEKKEKLEKKEQEKKEKIEKKELEKKEKSEKKELEKKEKIEKKEKEKQEKLERKELEKKEKLEKKEQEKKEKVDKKEQEKKEKVDKKEQEKREKLEKKEMEMKEKAEKKEKDRHEKEQIKLEREKVKKEKEEQRKVKEQLRLDKEKEREQKRLEKEEQEKKKSESNPTKEAESGEKKRKKKKEEDKIFDAIAISSNDQVNNKGDSTEQSLGDKRKTHVVKARKMGKKNLGKVFMKKKRMAIEARKKSLRKSSVKRSEPKESAEDLKPNKRGRRKRDEVALENIVSTRRKRVAREVENSNRPTKKCKVNKKQGEESAPSPRSPRGTSPRTSRARTLKEAEETKAPSPKKVEGITLKKKGRPGRPPRLSVKDKSKDEADLGNIKTVNSKGKRGPKPGWKKRLAQQVEENSEVIDKTEVTKSRVGGKKSIISGDAEDDIKSKESAPLMQTNAVKISTRRKTAVAAAAAASASEVTESGEAFPPPGSPTCSEEQMPQGNASPYRVCSDSEEAKEEAAGDEVKESDKDTESLVKSPTADDRLSSSPAKPMSMEDKDEEDSQSNEREALNRASPPNFSNRSDTGERDAGENEVGQNDDAYSSDDDVSNDIPLTPPRAPAPPPMESSDDEMEEPVDTDPSAPFSVPGPTTPFSVPGPNTPFSVPGPHTPFSVPPPTNLMQQQHSVQSEDNPMSTAPPSQGSVDMQQSLGSVEMQQSHGSVEINSHNSSVEMKSQVSADVSANTSSGDMQAQSSAELPSHGSVEVHRHNSVEMSHQTSIHGHSDNTPMGLSSQRAEDIYSHHSATDLPHSEASTIQKLRDEAMSSVKSSEVINDSSAMDRYQLVESMGKYGLPQPLPDHSHSEADKAYFDQYLKSLSASRGGLIPSSSPTGLQQLEAMVIKSSHVDGGSKSPPLSSLPTSVITSLESNLHGVSRTREEITQSEIRAHHDSLHHTRDSPSTRHRPSTDRPGSTAPLPPPPPTVAPATAFEAFPHLNPLHAPSASTPMPGRESAYLRQTENLFPTPPVSTSFMAEAMFQRQTMGTPFLPPPPTQTPHNGSSSSLLRRPPGSEMFSAPQAVPPAMQRNPFTNAWASQEAQSNHWQTTYLPRQSNMATPGYLTGRDFMFDPASVRASAEGRAMFPALSSSAQSQDTLPLDRFDLSNYFPNATAMTPYGSSAASASSLDYTRTTKSFDDRYRQSAVGAAATPSAIPDFRSLPAGSGRDMFPGIPGVSTGFNLYAGQTMPYHHHHPHHHTQHPHSHPHQLTDGSMNSAFLSHHAAAHHPSSAQHAMFERDYRGLYPQTAAAAYNPFINDRQYAGGASKLGHPHPAMGTSSSVTSADRDLMSRAAGTEGQMQDPYRTMLYKY